MSYVLKWHGAKSCRWDRFDHFASICADSFPLISFEDVMKMRALFSEEFFQRFHMAYRNYEERLPRVSEGQTY